MIKTSTSPDETFSLGKEMGEKAEAGDVILLKGDLGTGKTVFAKGFAEGLGIPGNEVASPTFTILQEYHQGRLLLYHFDVYRIEEPEEMEETGFFDLIGGDGVTLIEWPEKIEALLSGRFTEVVLEKQPENGADFRQITIKTVEIK